jgi:hypothetical protein
MNRSGITAEFRNIIELADSAVRRFPVKMKWMWGEALLGYALTELDAFLGEDRYLGFTEGYCEYWAAKGPRVDQSDTSAPALITYAMQKRSGRAEYAELTEKVLDYIRHAPRVLDDAVNHLGSSPEGRFYPRSIWVDSLMMFSVFPARYAAETATGSSWISPPANPGSTPATCRTARTSSGTTRTGYGGQLIFPGENCSGDGQRLGRGGPADDPFPPSRRPPRAVGNNRYTGINVCGLAEVPAGGRILGNP